MKPKNYLLTFAVCILTLGTYAQQGLQKKADSLFNKFAFVDAANAYKKLVEKDYNAAYATRQLGDCYAYMRNPEKAATYYKNAVAQENVPIEYYYKYAQALRGTKDYKASRVWLKKFKDAGGVIDKNKITRDPDFITAVFNARHKYFLKDVNINSDLSDFGAFEQNGKVYFTSSADKGVLTKHLYAWNEQPFLDVYVTEKNADTIIHHLSKVKGDINSVYHDGPVVITKDGKTMYFSRNNFNDKKLGKDRYGISNLKIYKASLIEDEWTNIEELPFNNDDYSVGHPSLNSDETKLYFASDMPGGLGGSDIYYVDIDKNGNYGKPQNAGNVINTKRNELFPFINTEDILFFSSDGHLGLGLLDVFATVYDENGTLTDVVNLGIPVNSNKDDFSFFMNNDGINGYIASNRDGGKGDDDIYAFNRIPRLKLEGTITDSIGNVPVENAIVTLSDADGNKIAYVETDENGEYDINIDRETDYVVTTTKDGYPEYSASVTTKGLDNTIKSITADFEISPIQKTVEENMEQEEEIIIDDLGPIYFNFDSAKIRKDDSDELARIVDLMVNTYPEMTIKIESHTDSRGPAAYNDMLSNRRATATYNYLTSKGVDASRIIEYKGYGESNLTNGCDGTVRCTEAQHQLNRRTNFIVIKVK
ncbi:flagellar motor protein MotB [Hyunsoonleella flava]|uniref:Flagellar motor protein MotB n=2 Tax=Pseudomonadati TaxID=3379134 RepID=A0A4Q9FE02_9FLAO|nr:OmpA family protein [Hyunsoonleella flava]TBN03027.1 flagellar motor protein MotB [Hyunsoonleella flava]